MKLNIITALPCEAKVIYEGLQLVRDLRSQRLPLFSDPKRRIYLVISGMGQVASAIATTYCGQFDNKPVEVQKFLNLGIAGSGAYTQGTIVLANQCRDYYQTDSSPPHSRERAKVYYPGSGFFASQPFPTARLITTPVANASYPTDNVMFDMEATGFFAGAQLFSPRDFIQSAKVISDGPDFPLDTLNPKSVEALMASLKAPLMSLCHEFHQYGQKQIAPLVAIQESTEAFVQKLCETLKVSFYQRAQLSETVRRFLVRHQNERLEYLSQKARDGGQLLRLLEDFEQRGRLT